MKIDKKKIVFASIVVMVLIFIVSYTTLVFLEEEEIESLTQPMVPELSEEQKTYDSKMEALDDLKEERERQIPSVYSEDLLDSLGIYAPALKEEEREWTVDSIFEHEGLDHGPDVYYQEEDLAEEAIFLDPDQPLVQPEIATPELNLGHREFFNIGLLSEISKAATASKSIRAFVNGSQTVRNGDRLELILKDSLEVGGKLIPKNSLVYAFVGIKKNRVQLKITHVNGTGFKMSAYDLQDSNEGIYVRNSFSAEAGREVLDDVVQDINIAGLPQVGGIKNIFRRNNRNLKVSILDQYQLILKSEL